MERIYSDPNILSKFSHKLTSYYWECSCVCLVIGRHAFGNLITYLASFCSTYSALEIRVVSACKSILKIRYTKF